MNYKYMEALRGKNHVEVDQTIDSWYQKATMFEAMVESEMQFRVLTLTALEILLGDPPADAVEDLVEMVQHYTAAATAAMRGADGQGEQRGREVEEGGGDSPGSGGPETGGGAEDRGRDPDSGDPGKEN